MTIDAIDGKRLIEIFEAMDDAAGRDTVKREHQILCVFGAAAILSYGSNARQTQDIDVWRPASRINDRAIRQMADAAGLDFNPTELEPERLYLQIVDDGVVRLPRYDRDEAVWSTGKPNEHVWSGNHITIVAPPPEIVAAAKLVRGEPQDIEDVSFLMNAKGVSARDIAKAISHFPAEKREMAKENMVFLGYPSVPEGHESSKKINSQNRGGRGGMGE